MAGTTFYRLALFGLMACSSFVLAENKILATLALDGLYTLAQKNAAGVAVSDAAQQANTLYITKARLDMSGDIAPTWRYFIRIGYNEYNNAQLDLDYTAFYRTTPVMTLPFFQGETTLEVLPLIIPRAYATWTGLKEVNVSLGLIESPNISSNNLYYKPYIGPWPQSDSIGSIVDPSGEHLGLSFEGKSGLIGYSFGFWKQADLRKIEGFTPTAPSVTSIDFNTAAIASLAEEGIQNSNFDMRTLRLGYAVRMHFSPKVTNGYGYSIGVGHNRVPLNAPIVVGTFESGISGATASSELIYTLVSFNQLSNFALDASILMGAMQINLGFQNQKISFDSSQGYGAGPSGTTPITTNASKIFNEDSKAVSWWVEAGYLLAGNGYKFDSMKGVISGLHLKGHQVGLEIVGRFGYEIRNNALALLNQEGFADFSSSVSGDTPQATTNLLVNGQILPIDLPANNVVILLGVDNSNPPGQDGVVDSQQLVLVDTYTYRTKVNGYVLGLNYYLNEQSVIRVELDQRHNKFERMTTSSDWMSSLNAGSLSTLRIRAEFSF